ncbi:MAG: ZapG family protein [Symbiopectobacterium sp.]
MATLNCANNKHCKASWKKSKTELEIYRQELVGHFARSAELLDNMAKDHR